MSNVERIPSRAERFIHEYLGWEQRRLERAIERTDRYIDAYLNGLRFMRSVDTDKDKDPGCSRSYVPEFASETKLSDRS